MKIIHGRAAVSSTERRSATFTGEVWADPILAATDGVTINNVFFAPQARTHWHTHEGGQVLMVIYGEGKIRAEAGDAQRIRPGDTVWIQPGERHWHGAGETTCMAHVAISLGGPEWLEPVTDEEYRGSGADGTIRD
ncbi:MAG: cupin domain-containing protein [Solirubrobacterales bacterium]|nr:cupin domain-containing protein [Solirubrobacterales bacterium]MBV9368082.1 cupin domain-containing protein [Solirubrobacterales bacterium]MBV9684038.1 cupin domain-containing protein [Solirubrobacterales bacterium]MBV9810055.1 cupin domain-containing protein [Solirubrobacterales bacterium]